MQSIGISAALKQVEKDNEHRTQHWVRLIAIANSLGANDAKIARLEKEVEELKSAVHRSWSPRMRPKQRALPQSQKMLALPAPASSSSQPKGSGRKSHNDSQQRNRRDKGAAGGKGSGKGEGVMSFEMIMDTLGQTKAFSMFHSSQKEMCFKFQKGECNNFSTCARKHSCVGCGAKGKP